ncbi:MAG: hypothetical protein IT208_03030 [Chthonomonadales bacterium]|nr:hypothetical protein [Chthonomonadales bacterium]
MKQRIHPAVAVAAIVVVIGIAAFAWTRFSGGAGSMEGQKPPGMPASVQEEFARRGASVAGPGANSQPKTLGNTPGGYQGRGGAPVPMAPR